MEDLPQQDSTNVLPVDPWSYSFGSTSLSSSWDEPSTMQDGTNNLFVDLQLRSRAEYRNGYSTLHTTNATPGFFVNERSRLSLGYEQPYLSVRVGLQHTGVWGDGTLNNSESGNVNLYEGWARVNSKQGLFVQAGRMPLHYDDGRIFGLEDWSTSGRSHDALKLGYEGALHKVHGVVSFNQTLERNTGDIYYNGLMPYKHMEMLWYHYGNNDSRFQFSVLGTNQAVQGGEVLHPVSYQSQTVGAWLQYDAAGFYAKAEGYYQMGKDSADVDISAYLASLRLGYKQSPLWSVEVGADYVSGDDGTRTDRVSVFNTLYGSSHEFLGSMDYFRQGDMIYTGLWDCLAKVRVNPNAKLALALDYHYYLTGTKISRLHSQMGHEIDLQVDWKFNRFATLQAGYSTMMATSTMYYFKGGNNKQWQDWGWISLNVNPHLFVQLFRR